MSAFRLPPAAPEHRQRLSPAAAPRRPAVPRHLPIRPQRRSDRADRRAPRTSGALTVGIVNAPTCPLAAACDIVLPIGAGPELSVAATKTFVATAGGAGAADRRLGGRQTRCRRRIERLPERLAAAAALDWSAALRRSAGAAQPGHDRPRADARHRARGGAQAEGDLQPAMPKRSAAPSSCTGRWRWSRRAIRS